MKKLGILVIELAIITLFAASLWSAAGKIKNTDAFDPDLIRLVD